MPASRVPSYHSPMSASRPSLRRYFVSGLLTLLPIWLTWVVFSFVFVLLSGLSKPWVGPLSQNIANAFPRALGWLDDPWSQTGIALGATLVTILAVGVLAHRVIGQRLIGSFERGIARVPLANSVYSGSRKLVDILKTKPDGAQRVVLIDFPHKDAKAIGFLTRVLRDQDTGMELAAVFVPTTPNPTGGYLELVPMASLTPTDWTVDQAMSFILTGGAVAPDRIPFRPPLPPVA
jgi:uncharacterized membrane protein